VQSELFSLAHIRDIADYKLNIPVPAPRLLNHDVSYLIYSVFLFDSYAILYIIESSVFLHTKLRRALSVDGANWHSVDPNEQSKLSPMSISGLA